MPTRKRDKTIMWELWQLPGVTPQKTSDSYESAKFTGELASKYRLSYKANVKLRALLNVLIHNGLSRASAERVIDGIFEAYPPSRNHKVPMCATKETKKMFGLKVRQLLGNILIEMGAITKEQLIIALKLQMVHTRKLLGEILVEMKVVNHAQILQALRYQPTEIRKA